VGKGRKYVRGGNGQGEVIGIGEEVVTGIKLEKELSGQGRK